MSLQRLLVTGSLLANAALVAVLWSGRSAEVAAGRAPAAPPAAAVHAPPPLVRVDIDEDRLAARLAERLAAAPAPAPAPADEADPALAEDPAAPAATAADIERAREVVRAARAQGAWTVERSDQLHALLAQGDSPELAAVVRDLFAAINRGEVALADDFPAERGF